MMGTILRLKLTVSNGSKSIPIHNLKHDETHTAGALPSPTIEGIWGVSFEVHDAINSSSRVEQSLKPAQLGPINPVCRHVP